MSIFQEVILKLIRTTCEGAIKISETLDESYLWSYTRNPVVADAKRKALQELLNTPRLTHNQGKNDLERLSIFQSLLMHCKEEVIRARGENTPQGSTEPLLDHLADSLKLTYDKFEHMGLLNCPSYRDDPLTTFYALIGLYYAKKMLRTKQQPTEQGALSQLFLNINPFITMQEKLVNDFFEYCQGAIKSFDQLSHEASKIHTMLSQTSHPINALRTSLVLSSLYRLSEQHETLCAEYSLASKTAGFQFFRKALIDCLEDGKQTLNSLCPCGSDVKPVEAAIAPGTIYRGLTPPTDKRITSDASDMTSSNSMPTNSPTSTQFMLGQLQETDALPTASLQTTLAMPTSDPSAVDQTPLTKTQKKLAVKATAQSSDHALRTH